MRTDSAWLERLEVGRRTVTFHATVTVIMTMMMTTATVMMVEKTGKLTMLPLLRSLRISRGACYCVTLVSS